MPRYNEDDMESPEPPEYGASGENKNDRKAPGGDIPDKKKHGGHGGGGYGGTSGGPGPVIPQPQPEPVEPDPVEPNYSADVWEYIHYAASRANNNHSEMSSRIKSGNVNARGTTTGYTPLHVAVKFDQIEAVRQLIKAGAQIDSRDVLEQTPLSLACCYKINEDIYRLLLDAGANPNHEDLYTWRPLFWAACKGYYNVADLLLKKGASTSKKDKKWQTPYDVTSSQQIKNLLRRG